MMSFRELIVLLMMCTLWGFHFVIIKLAVGEVPPLFYAAMRITVVALLMSPFLRWRSGAMGPVLLAGCCLGGFNYAFMFTGIAKTTASSAALAIELFVPFATILSVLFLGDKVGLRRFIGIVLAFVGVAVIALAGKENSTGGDPQAVAGIGIGLIAIAAFSEAMGTIFVKKAKGFTPFQLLAWFALVGTAILWPATFLTESFWREEGPRAVLEAVNPVLLLGAIVYSAVGASIIGHSSYYWLLQRLPVSIVAPSGLLTTMLAVLFSVLVLGDQLTAVMIIGALMILTGVGVILVRNSTRASGD